jgi:hypothetical protein
MTTFLLLNFNIRKCKKRVNEIFNVKSIGNDKFNMSGDQNLT